MNTEDVKIIGEWDDSLIWCPSQCELKMMLGDKKYVLYLRWRWQDPWTADVILADNVHDIVLDANEWHELEVGFFKDTELEQLKPVAIEKAKEKIISINNVQTVELPE